MADINKALGTMGKWLKEVSTNNDHEIDQTKDLKMILLNLKIVCSDNKAVAPIADALARTILEMNESTTILVNEGRKELRQALADIKEYVEEKEGNKNEY